MGDDERLHTARRLVLELGAELRSAFLAVEQRLRELGCEDDAVLGAARSRAVRALQLEDAVVQLLDIEQRESGGSRPAARPRPGESGELELF